LHFRSTHAYMGDRLATDWFRDSRISAILGVV
jgi:hypothetical protein